MNFHPHSSLCRAAIHTGAINNPGGVIEIIIKWHAEVFFGKESKGVISEDYDQPEDITFCTSRPNTISIQLAIDFEERDKDPDFAFLEVDEQVELMPKMNSFTSFLQMKEADGDNEPAPAVPKFQWVKPASLSKFIGKNQDLATIGTAEALACGKDLGTFTILGEVNMEVATK
jgi:hypothetical protein